MFSFGVLKQRVGIVGRVIHGGAGVLVGVC